MKSFKKQLIIAVLLVAQPIVASAESSFDFGEIFSILKDMAMQSTIVGNNSTGQLNALNEQKKILEDTQKLMQGHYGYGSYDNPSLSSWQHAGKDWSSLLNSHQSGGNDPLASLAREIEHEFPIVSSDRVYSSSKNPEQAKLFDLLSKATVASRASNTLAYNNVDAELIMLEKLQAEIEKSPNQKATLDLIARIQIEEAKLMAYQIKSSAVSAQLTGLQAQQEVSDAKWMSEFFKWH